MLGGAVGNVLNKQVEDTLFAFVDRRDVERAALTKVRLGAVLADVWALSCDRERPDQEGEIKIATRKLTTPAMMI